jgi:hypothetical protein
MTDETGELEQCEHGPDYICGLCMEPTEDIESGHDCRDDPGGCDYDCPRFVRSHAGF